MARGCWFGRWSGGSRSRCYLGGHDLWSGAGADLAAVALGWVQFAEEVRLDLLLLLSVGRVSGRTPARPSRRSTGSTSAPSRSS